MKEAEAASLLLKAAAAEDAATSAASVHMCSVSGSVLLSGVTFRLPSCAPAALGDPVACAASAIFVCVYIIDASCNHASARCWLTAFSAMGLHAAMGSVHAIKQQITLGSAHEMKSSIQKGDSCFCRKASK